MFKFDRNNSRSIIFPTKKILPFHSSRPLPMSRTGGKLNMTKRSRRNPHYFHSRTLGTLSEILLRNNITLLGDMKTSEWTTLLQERDQKVLEFTSIFDTLRMKMGIKEFEQLLVLKYNGYLHKYINE